jgi:hypothetical protein
VETVCADQIRQKAPPSGRGEVVVVVMKAYSNSLNKIIQVT